MDQRLGAVFPGIHFDVQKIVVSGWPWRTYVAVEWNDRVFDPGGKELVPNQGMLMLTLSWGRAAEFHVYCDTQALAANLDTLAAHSVAEAALPPISEPA